MCDMILAGLNKRAERIRVGYVWEQGAKKRAQDSGITQVSLKYIYIQMETYVFVYIAQDLGITQVSLQYMYTN